MLHFLERQRMVAASKLHIFSERTQWQVDSLRLQRVQLPAVPLLLHRQFLAGCAAELYQYFVRTTRVWI